MLCTHLEGDAGAHAQHDGDGDEGNHDVVQDVQSLVLLVWLSGCGVEVGERVPGCGFHVDGLVLMREDRQYALR